MRILVLGAVGVLALAGCGTPTPPTAAPAPATAAPTPATADSTPGSATMRSVQVTATFTDDPGTATTYDPRLVPVGARVAVDSVSGDAGTSVTLTVSGLEPDRTYGVHAHAQPCGATGEAAGPHFQHLADPAQPSVDPAYANPRNEIWLDITTDGDGDGSATAAVGWVFERTRRARSVVLHAMPTATDPGRAGTAGDRAACVTVGF